MLGSLISEAYSFFEKTYAYLSICLSVCLSVCLSLYLSACKRKKHESECVESVPTLLECAESFQDCWDPALQPQLLPETFINSLFFTEDQVKLVYGKMK